MKINYFAYLKNTDLKEKISSTNNSYSGKNYSNNSYMSCVNNSPNYSLLSEECKCIYLYPQDPDKYVSIS
jgi:hypothetical protein